MIMYSRLSLVVALVLTASVARAAGETSMAVMPLAPQRIPAEITTILDELLVTLVFERDGYKVIGASDINSMLGLEKMKSALGCDDVSCAAEIGGALGVDLMLAGTVGRLGDELIISLKLIDITSSELKNRVSLRIPNDEKGYATGMSDAVGKLLGDDETAAAETPAQATMAPTEVADLVPEPAAASETADPDESVAATFANAVTVGVMMHVFGFDEDYLGNDGTGKGAYFEDRLMGLSLEYRREYAGFLATRFRVGLGTRSFGSDQSDLLVENSSGDSSNFEESVTAFGAVVGLYEEVFWRIWQGRESLPGVSPSFDLYGQVGFEVMPPHANVDIGTFAAVAVGGGLRFYWLSADVLYLPSVAPGDADYRYKYRTETNPGTFIASPGGGVMIQAAVSFNF